MYHNAHRAVLQAFLSVGVMSDEDVKEVIKKACEKCNMNALSEDVDAFLAAINQKVKTVSMEIRSRRDENTGIQMFALVQTLESEIGKLASDFSESELKLFKGIVDTIVTSDLGVVPSIELLNLIEDNPEKRLVMRKTDKEACIRKFVEEKWLHKEDGKVSLAARSIMELEILLKDKYADDVTNCRVCEDLVIQGQRCENCGDVKLHKFCAARFFSNRPNPRCPNGRCQAHWPLTAVLDTCRDETAPSTSRLAGRKRRAARNT